MKLYSGVMIIAFSSMFIVGMEKSSDKKYVLFRSNANKSQGAIEIEVPFEQAQLIIPIQHFLEWNSFDNQQQLVYPTETTPQMTQALVGLLSHMISGDEKKIESYLQSIAHSQIKPLLNHVNACIDLQSNKGKIVCKAMQELCYKQAFEKRNSLEENERLHPDPSKNFAKKCKVTEKHHLYERVLKGYMTELIHDETQAIEISTLNNNSDEREIPVFFGNTCIISWIEADNGESFIQRSLVRRIIDQSGELSNIIQLQLPVEEKDLKLYCVSPDELSFIIEKEVAEAWRFKAVFP